MRAKAIEGEWPETVRSEIDRYVRTGNCDPVYRAWPGSIVEQAQGAERDLLQALAMEVRARTCELNVRSTSFGADVADITRRKVEPMIRGLFPKDERAAVLRVVERSVVFLGPDNIERVLLESTWLSTAWELANLYLESVGAELLGEDAPKLVGLSEETTCYVSPEYFDEKDPFADFIVHEVAHIFHNCKRHTVGLPETRRREWLLDIDFRKRETFAYACEAYARICERSCDRGTRLALAGEYAALCSIPDERVDPSEIVTLVRTACTARSGWKVILAGCAPKRAVRQRLDVG